MVEVIGVKVIHPDTVTTGADKRIGKGILIKNSLDGGHILIGEVATHHPFPVCGS